MAGEIRRRDRLAVGTDGLRGGMHADPVHLSRQEPRSPS